MNAGARVWQYGIRKFGKYENMEIQVRGIRAIPYYTRAQGESEKVGP